MTNGNRGNMRYQGVIKFLLICIIALSYYKYHKNDVLGLVDNTKITIQKSTQLFEEPSEDSAVKFRPDAGFVEKKLTIVANNILQTPEGKNFTKEALEAIKKRDIRRETIYSKGFYRQDVLINNSPNVALCGQEVEIEYSTPAVIDHASMPIAKQYNSSKVRLGAGQLPSLIEAGIVGMRQGSKAKIVSKDNGEDGKFVASEVTLKASFPAVKPALYYVVSYRNNESQKSDQFFACGENLLIEYQVHDLQGKLLYDSKQNNQHLTTKLGDQKLPLDIINAIHGASRSQFLYIVFASKQLAAFNFLGIPLEVLENNNSVAVSIFANRNK